MRLSCVIVVQYLVRARRTSFWGICGGLLWYKKLGFEVDQQLGMFIRMYVWC
jgi:hypothetical protein